MSRDEKLPWIQVDLSIKNIKTDEHKIKSLYLYEDDWDEIQRFIDSKKTNCTSKEMSQIFEYLCGQHKETLSMFDLIGGKKDELIDQLSKSEWLKKAMNELVKNLNNKKL